MRRNSIPTVIFFILLCTSIAGAGIEVVMESKVDIPGVDLKIMGKDFSRSEQRFLVNDDATLKGTVNGNTTQWIDLEREAFFDQTKRRCNVTTFDEMKERMEAFKGQESPFAMMGRDMEEPPERDAQEYELEFESRAGSKTEINGVTGTSAGATIKVIEKATGNLVSTIDTESVYAKNAELKLLQDFDVKLAKQHVKSVGEALGMDFDAMRERITGHPDMKMALEKMPSNRFVEEGHAVISTSTKITTTEAAMKGGQDRAEAEAGAESADEPKAGGFAGRMMAKMKARQAKKKAAKAESGGGSAGGEGPRTMSVSSVMQSHRSGVDVTLPQECVDAYNKKIR